MVAVAERTVAEVRSIADPGSIERLSFVCDIGLRPESASGTRVLSLRTSFDKTHEL